MTRNKSPQRTPQTLSELFNLGKENLEAKGVEQPTPVPSNYQASAETNSRLLDSIFMEPRFIDPVKPDSGLTLFGVKMKTPAFCSAMSKPEFFSDEEMLDLVRGMGNAGSMMTLGVVDSELLQYAIDTGTPIVKMVKPYRNTDLMFKEVREAEKRGCLAVGTDIDHFYGTYRDGRQGRSYNVAPKQTDELRQVIASTKLPFIIKGVLGVEDARKSAELGAAAVVVSNHGWGAFDFGVPAIAALPKVAKTIGKQVTVLVDGLRTGNDVFKTLALGAKGAGFANAILLSAAAGGAKGVQQFIDFITDELARTMAICGCPDLAAIDRSILVASPEIKPWW